MTKEIVKLSLPVTGNGESIIFVLMASFALK